MRRVRSMIVRLEPISPNPWHLVSASQVQDGAHDHDDVPGQPLDFLQADKIPSADIPGSQKGRREERGSDSRKSQRSPRPDRNQPDEGHQQEGYIGDSKQAERWNSKISRERQQSEISPP